MRQSAQGHICVDVFMFFLGFFPLVPGRIQYFTFLLSCNSWLSSFWFGRATSPWHFYTSRVSRRRARFVSCCCVLIHACFPVCPQRCPHVCPCAFLLRTYSRQIVPTYFGFTIVKYNKSESRFLSRYFKFPLLLVSPWTYMFPTVYHSLFLASKLNSSLNLLILTGIAETYTERCLRIS